MTNVLYKQEEKTFLFHNRGSVCSAGNAANKIDWFIKNRPSLSAKLIAVQCFNGDASMDNPRFAALVRRVELAKERAKPKAKPVRRGRPATKAGR